MIADIYELSPLQAGMLFHRLFAPESSAYFDQFSCRLTGDVDPARLRRAWQQIVDRHPVLRTSFHWEGLDKPVQVVHTEAELPWEVFDWRNVPVDDRARRWTAFLAADRARGFAPDVVPLMRVTLARLSEAEYFCCWSHHHLLLDGWCLSPVLSELFARYDALAHGRVASFPPVRPFAEYIKWLQQRDRAAIDQYWREALRGYSAGPPLFAPTGKVAGARPEADAIVTRRVGVALTGGLRALAARHRLTLSTLAQGAWALLLSRYGGTDDVVFGATVSGRPPDVAGIETMLGVFINTVPVRLRVRDDMTATSWLAEVQAAHVARESFATIPLSDIQKLADVDPGIPLFDTNVIVMNYRMDEALAGGAAGLRISDLQIVDQTDIPLTLQVTPGPQLTLEILYDSTRYEAAAMERMLGHVEYLLAQFEAGLDRPLGAFEIVTAVERAQLLDVLQATAAPLDPSRTAIDMWEAQVEATPDAIALECGNVRLTFRALNAWANRLARSLGTLAPGGSIGRDQLVAIAFPRSERFVAAVLAVWKCGAAYVPVDPDYPADRIRQVIATAGPCLVLRGPGTLDVGLEAGAGQTRFVSFGEVDDAAQRASDTNLDVETSGADLAYVIFTSGSTGQPKGAMVEQIGMVNHILAKIEDLHLGPDCVVVQNASHCFDISVWQCFAGMLAGGRTLVYTDDLVLDPARFLARVCADRVTVLEVVPSYLAPLLDRHEDDPRPLADLRYLLVTGETVKPSLVARWFRSCPSIPMVNAYGPTEASDDITHAFMHAPPPTPSVPVGRPVRNFHIYVVDARMRLCPTGVPGELCVSGPGVGRGYLGDPARTSAQFLEDPFREARHVRMYRTGDIGWYAEDGTLLLSGRKDHQVKVRGYRIELGDIEAALTGLDIVVDAVVVDRRDRASDDAYLAAYVTVRDPLTAPDLILEALTDRLPDYMIPAVCTVLPALPLTPNGKIDRAALPAPAASRSSSAGYVAPRTAIEETLAGIWGDVLGVDQPGVDDNFFAVGGDSILSMQLVSRAARAGLDLTPRDVFQHQTIAALALTARPLAVRTGATSTRVGPAPLAPAQRQFFTDVTVDRHHYNQSILLEVPADFDLERATRALDAVVRHHDALRLRFAERDGAWQQTVALSSPPAIDVHDLSTIPEAERASAVEPVGSRVQASLDITVGPLLRAAWFPGAGGKAGLLLIVAHHLAVDGVSWRIVLDDLTTAYEALGEGQVVALPPVATSYLEWIDWVGTQRPRALIDLKPHEHGVDDLPTDVPLDRALNTVASTQDLEFAFDEPTTRGCLTLAAHAYGAGPTDLLVAAVAAACGEWTGWHRVRIDLETHGRETPTPLDVTRTVGWFTSTEPVAVDIPERPDGPGDLVAAATAGRHEVFAVSDPAVTRPAILLNYHGRIDQDTRAGWRLSSESHGPGRSPRQEREYLIEINGLVDRGRLRLTLTFCRHLHRVETMQALAAGIERHLKVLVAHAQTSAGLDQLLAGVGDVEDVYDLSPTQDGLLFHALAGDAGDAYFNQLTCVLEGELDVTAFQGAWQATVARHAVLRTSFHWQGLARPVQIVHGHADVPWRIDDWSTLPDQVQVRRWAQHGDDDRRRPFDVSVAPLMRCALARVGPTTWRFRWSQHHLLLDGWSAAIVLGDVMAAYEAIVHGGRNDAPPPPLFREHIRWLQAQDRSAARRFWQNQLAGIDHSTPLMLGLPEMDGQSRRRSMAEVEARVPEALTSRLTTAAAANHVTLHTLFQGAWALLLARYSGQNDVVFGSITSGRSAALTGSDRMVGLFINTLPVRATLTDDAPVFDWLRDLQRAHADREMYAYSSLADIQRQSAVAGGTPLFETILIVENYPIEESLRGDRQSLTVRDVRAREPNNYPVAVVVTPGAAIDLKIMFDEGRFDRATIERTLGHLTTILSGIVDATDGPVGAVPMLTAAERAAIESWNDTGHRLPEADTVLSLIEAHARQAPGRTAVVCEGRRLTYGDLDAWATRLARVFMATGRCGASDQRAVVLLPRSERLLATILALWKCGVAYVPLDPEYPAARIATVVADARPALVIVDDDRLSGTAGSDGAAGLHGAAGLQPGGTTPPPVVINVAETTASADDARTLPSADPADLAYVIYTSGSTGAPKGALLEHRGLLNHVLSMVDDLGLGPHSVVAQTASHCFDISMWQLFAGLVAGGTTVMYPDDLVHQPAALAARFEADGVTAAQFVPSYLNVFLDAGDDAGPGLSSLVHMVVIGEALTPATIARWFRHYPRIPLMNAYGPTEGSDSVAHFDMTGPLGDALVPIGRPIRNMALYVVDAAMRLCPVGVKGEICIAGVGVGRGYLFDDARTRAAFLSDPFVEVPRRLYRTGDIGCYRPDGALLFFGRRDHQVKIRGHRIELGEVEACLAEVAGVRDAVVVMRERATGDRILCAYATAQAGHTLDTGELLRQLADRLPHHAVPDAVQVLDEMPVLENGKVNRRALAAREVVVAGATTLAAPGTETEAALLRIWSEVLGRSDIGVDQSLFDVGGHSLTAIQIVSRINRDRGVDLSVGDLFECGTVQGLAARVDTASAVAGIALVPLPEQDSYEVSPTQARIWLASQTPAGSSAHNMAGVFWLNGEVDVAALTRAFDLVVDRHEALRTVFAVVNGSLRQRVRSHTKVGSVCRVTDWSAGVPDGGDRDAAVQARVADPFDLARGPLFDVELIHIADRRHILIVRLHHIVGDATSIRIILGEALQVYGAVRRGETPLLAPLPVQYRDVVAWQRQRLAAGAAEKSRRFWGDTVSAAMPRAGFPADGSVASSGGGVAVSCDLDAARTAALREVAAGHGATVFGVVVSAVFALLYRYTGQEDLGVGTTVSRRDHPWLEQQVGCYIDTLVLRGRAAGSDTAGELLARTTRVCREALAHADYPFESLLDDLQAPVPAGGTPLFDVLVDYVPGQGAGGELATLSDVAITEYRREVESVHYDSMFLIGDAEAGDGLSIQLVFRAGRFSTDTVAQVSARLATILYWLVDDGSASLAELDLLPVPSAPRRRLRVGLNTG